MRIDPKTISQPDLHGILLGVIAPRPIAWASTIDKEGHVNLAPYSFFNVFSSNPATLIPTNLSCGCQSNARQTMSLSPVVVVVLLP